MLAIVFGCTRFHEYIFGLSSVEIETDDKPDSDKATASENDDDNSKIPIISEVPTWKRTSHSRHPITSIPTRRS